MNDIENDDIFAGLDLPEPNEDTTPDPVATEPEVEETTPEPAPAPVAEEKPQPSQMEQFDQFYNYKKQMEEYQSKLASYEQKEAEEKARLSQEQEKIPDPAYDPVGYTKWIEGKLKNQEESYNTRIQQVKNDLIYNTINEGLVRSRKNVEDQYGSEVVDEAEKWAISLLQSNPKEALGYLQANPSYDYIVTEYRKMKDRQDFNKDPDAYVMRRYQELNNQNQSAPADTYAPQVKQPKKSINSIPSARDPKPEVPVFLQGL